MNEAAVFAKVAWRLLPLMVLLYVVSFLDRVNVGFAALSMNADLHFSPAIYGFGAGIFFWGYFLFELPSNLIMARVGARIWIFRIMLSWGLVSMATIFVHTPMQFYAIRFLLGLAEAGFFPGMILYLTYWFPGSIRARYFALFLAAVPLANIVGGPISGTILSMGHLWGLRDWQWLFLIEGVPACLLAFVVLIWLPDGPGSARWLSNDEKAQIAARLAAEPEPVHLGLGTLFSDIRVWLCTLVYFGVVVATYGVNFWLPQIVKAMGYTNFQTGLWVTLPYLLGMPFMVHVARSSDRRGERIWHAAGVCALAAVGLVVTASGGEHWFEIAGLCLAVAGILGALGIFWTLPTSIMGQLAAAGGIAVVNSIGNLGGFFGPVIIGGLTQMTGNFRYGLAAIALEMLAVAALVLLLGRLLPLRPSAAT